MAMKEPRHVGDFAEHQCQRAKAKRESVGRNEERRRESEAEIAFWELVQKLCDGKPPKMPWSLIQMRDQALPAELQEEKPPLEQS